MPQGFGRQGTAFRTVQEPRERGEGRVGLPVLLLEGRSREEEDRGPGAATKDSACDSAGLRQQPSIFLKLVENDQIRPDLGPRKHGGAKRLAQGVDQPSLELLGLFRISARPPFLHPPA
jgi:hypothetical protein